MICLKWEAISIFGTETRFQQHNVMSEHVFAISAVPFDGELTL